VPATQAGDVLARAFRPAGVEMEPSRR
jgi:hypothetical protein